MKSTSLKVVKLEKHCPRVSKMEFENQPQIPKTPSRHNQWGPPSHSLQGHIPPTLHPGAGWHFLTGNWAPNLTSAAHRISSLTGILSWGGRGERIFRGLLSNISNCLWFHTKERKEKEGLCTHTPPLPQSSWRAPTSVANSHGSLLPPCEGRAEGRRGAGRADLGAGIQGRALQAPCKRVAWP